MSLTLCSRQALLYQPMKDWKSKLQPSGWILYRWQWHKYVEYQNQSMTFVSLFLSYLLKPYHKHKLYPKELEQAALILILMLYPWSIIFPFIVALLDLVSSKLKRSIQKRYTYIRSPKDVQCTCVFTYCAIAFQTTLYILIDFFVSPLIPPNLKYPLNIYTLL